ncbi:MAG: molybdopterin-dependent oxidoreductase [Candidatus Aminicenantes bacterium]|nr:molybdopterin-dependent oxidoreductase [Candidatus Aminicenantes bacterium]
MGLKRRDFLKIIGGSALSFSLYDCSTKNYLSPIREKEWSPKVEEWIQSVCFACPGGCGILGRVVDGKLVKIEGNPAHPINRGKLCPVGQASLQVLYSPDRIKGPMKKIGGKDSSKWQSISWEEAMETLVSKLKELRNAGDSHKLVLLNGGNRGILSEIFDRFMKVFGSPNHFRYDFYNSLTQAYYLTQGIDELLAYDFENSNYILSFGSSFLTSWPSPVQSMRAYAFLRQGRPGKKAKIAQIEPRFSIAACRADKWIPIEPGTEGLLALGIAYVLIKERLYDRNFIEKFTFGFEDWEDEDGNSHYGYKNLVSERYRLDFVSETTGVSVDDIVTLAKDFAMNKPAIAILDHNATNYSNGLYNALAIHSLNALIGSIDVPGGVLVQRKVPLQELPKISVDEATKMNLSQPAIDSPEEGQFPLATSTPSLIPENILKGKPYPVNLAFICKANPLFSSPNSEKYRKAFEKIPFIVSFSSFMDESTLYADLVLPDKTYLEKWQYAESSPVSKTPAIGIGKPIVENLFNAKPTEDVILEAAQRMGSSFASHFPWKNSKDFLLYKIDTLFRARKGIIFSDPFEETQLKLLEERGWWVPQFTSASEFKAELMQKGGWWDPAYSFGQRSFVFRTPSRKFEFYSQLFVKRIEKIAEQIGENREDKKDVIFNQLNFESRGDDFFMAHYEKPQFEGDKKEFPLYLYIYQPFSLTNEYEANQPWFQEIMGFHLNMNWDSWAEINPHTASELGIADNDLIWIESVHGKVRVKAKIYSGAMPDVVSVPFGLGHRALGQWAKNRGINPIDLIGANFDQLTGLAMKLSTRVKIYRA